MFFLLTARCVAPVRTDARGILPQHCLGFAVLADIDRRQEVEPGAGGQQVGDDGRVGILLRRGRQRRCTRRIAGVGIGPEFQQQLHDPPPVSRCRMVQRRAAMMVARHPCGH
jgi:hypothetical protein